MRCIARPELVASENIWPAHENTQNKALQDRTTRLPFKDTFTTIDITKCNVIK